MAIEEKVNIGISATLDNNGDKSVKTLKQSLREAVEEAQKLSAIDLGSKEAIEAQKRVAFLKNEIDDFNDRINALHPDNFRAIGQVAQGIAGGFAAAQGAMALFGSESEDLQKTLVKVQGALALSQGLESIKGLVDNFKSLSIVIKTQVVTAFTTLRGAIMATGIGALVVSIGLLLANLDKVIEAIDKVIPGFKKFTQSVEDNTKALDENIKANQAAQNQFKAIIDLRLSLMQEGEEKQIAILKERARRDIADVQRQVENEHLKAEQIILINANLEKEIDKVRTDAANKRAAEQKAEIEKRKAAEQSRINEMLKAADEQVKGWNQQEQKILSDREKAYGDNSTALKNSFTEQQITLVEALTAQQITQQEFDAQSLELRRQQLEAKKALDEQYYKDTTDIDLEIANTKYDIAKSQMEVDKNVAAAAVENAAATGNALSGLSALAGQATAEGKALGVASATIDTFIGANKAIAQGGVWGTIAAIGIIASGLANVRNIIATKVPSVKGASASAPTASVSTPAMPPAFVSPNAINVQGAGALNVGSPESTQQTVYVVESDIRRTGTRVQVVESRAGMG